MRHFSKIIRLARPIYLLWLFPILLIVPNAALGFTEMNHTLSKATNIVLPLGIYYLMMAWSRNTGRTTLLCIPLMFYAAFQIVLLYLYGESIIAIDMFLNVVTTNVSEATELLGNLSCAILIICIVYIPPIIWAVILVSTGQKVGAQSLRAPRTTGIVLTCVGTVMIILCYCCGHRYMASRELFPINVACNMVKAVKRTIATRKYHETSNGFSYRAKGTRDKDLKEIYVLVIGETSRADNWQILGYDRPTNPMLSKRSDIIVFDKALSETNTTHKSVPMILSYLDAENFGDSIYHTKGILSAFNEAGYRTAFLSNQRRNHSFIDFFASEAQVVDFIIENGSPQLDEGLITPLKDFIMQSPSNKMFIILHCYGSHFNYKERYSADYAYFTPDDASGAKYENRDKLINAYDNTILYTDRFLDDVINTLEGTGFASSMFYLSDHGEDIFDDERKRFLHSSPTPTYYQIHVPIIIWMSDKYRELYPEKFANAKRLTDKNISSSRSAFNTLIDIAGIDTPYRDKSQALTSGSYQEPKRMYITDYNEGVPLKHSGLRKQDFSMLNKNNISAD